MNQIVAFMDFAQPDPVESEPANGSVLALSQNNKTNKNLRAD